MASQNKVALFGGGFNPVGRHHEFIATLIHKHTNMRVWLMPCYDHAFDKDSELIEAAHRWNMTKQVADSYGSFLSACDWEIAHQSRGRMYDTIRELQQNFPDIDFTIVIGMDNANVIRLPVAEGGWYRGKELIQEETFIVCSRKVPCPVCHGDDKVLLCDTCKDTGSVWQEPEDDWFRQEPHMELQVDYPASSSGIRQACREGKLDYVKQHTHPMTWDYIKSGRLFGFSDETVV